LAFKLVSVANLSSLPKEVRSDHEANALEARVILFKKDLMLLVKFIFKMRLMTNLNKHTESTYFVPVQNLLTSCKTGKA